MKKLVLFAVVLAAVSFSSCSKCKTCSIQSAGVTVPGSPEEEYCGDELEKIEDENVCVLGTGYCCD